MSGKYYLIILKKAERYVAEDSYSVSISYIVKDTQKCYVKQSSSMQPWIENLHRQHQRKFGKKLRRLSPISYYSNTSAPQWTLLRGDIETNPERKSTASSRSTPTTNKQNSKKPTIKRKIAICSLCVKTVSVNAKLMICTYCKIMIHSHSTNTRAKTISDTKNAKEWTFFCASTELPFHKVRDELNTDVESDENTEMTTLKNLINLINTKEFVT